MSDNSDTGLDETGQMPAPSESTTPLFENPYTPGDIPADASFADVHTMANQIDTHTRNIPDPMAPSAPPAPEPTMADVNLSMKQAKSHIARISPGVLPSDTIIKIGDQVTYIKKGINKTGEILLVHYDDYPPLYYTVRFPDGKEVQTIGKYLTIIPRPVRSSKKSKKKTPPVPVFHSSDEVIWTGEGVPKNSIIIGDTPDKGGDWVDIITNSGRRISVPKSEINRNLSKDIVKSLEELHWETVDRKGIYPHMSYFVAILAWLSIPAPPTQIGAAFDNDFIANISMEIRRNWMLYCKFKYEWKNENLCRSQLTKTLRSLSYLEYGDIDAADTDHTDMIVLLQATSNIIGRPIHLITSHVAWMDVITVQPDSTISAAELHNRRISHGETARPDSHPVWIKNTPEGYRYSNTKTNNYTPRDGGYYVGDDNIPSYLVTSDEKENAESIIQRTEQQRRNVIKLGQQNKQERDNRPKGCCGGSTRSHRKRKTRKTRKMLKNRKKIKKTTHKRGRKTKTRKPRKTRKLRR